MKSVKHLIAAVSLALSLLCLLAAGMAAPATAAAGAAAGTAAGAAVGMAGRPEVADAAMPGSEPAVGFVGDGPAVELSPSAMAARQRGPGSPAREIEWVLAFQPPTFNQQYTQYLNIVYDSGAETGFFATGSIYVGTQLYLPSVHS